MVNVHMPKLFDKEKVMKRSFYIVLGCLLTSIGTIILQHAHVMTGGTAGLSLILSYVLGIPFGAVFFLINVPFYVLAVKVMGWSFTVSTLFAVTLVSFMTGLDQFISDFSISMPIGSVLGGAIIGFGISILFMNRTSLGGTNILALILQKKLNWNPGKLNFIFDFLVVCFGFYSVGVVQGLLSILSIALTSGIISYFKNKIAVSNQSVQQHSHVKQYAVGETAKAG